MLPHNTRTHKADRERLWSSEVEKLFKEAMALYPSCGPRKKRVVNGGKPLGRNELIAEYIKLHSGEVRTRKQISSHILVHARRRARESYSKVNATCANNTPDSAMTSRTEALSSTSVGVGGVGSLATGVSSQYPTPTAYQDCGQYRTHMAYHDSWQYPTHLAYQDSWQYPTRMAYQDSSQYPSPMACPRFSQDLSHTPCQNFWYGVGTTEQQGQPVGEAMSARRPLSLMNSTGLRSSELCEFSAFDDSRLRAINSDDSTNGSAGSRGGENDAEWHLHPSMEPSPQPFPGPPGAMDLRSMNDKSPD